MSFPSLPPAQTSITVGRGGYIEVDPHLYRVSWDNQYIEDMTPYLISGSVTHDVSRTNGNWILEADITYDGWLRLHPFEDYLAVLHRVTYADGSVKANQLGQYLVLDSPEHREEIGGTVRVDARDNLWSIWAQGLPTVFAAPTGINGPTAAVGNAVIGLVNACTVPGNPLSPIFSRFRHTLTNYGFETGLDWLIFDEGERVLEAVNAMLTGTNRRPLTTRNDGWIFTEQSSFINLYPPIRTWYANPPPGPFNVGAIQNVNPSAAERAYSPIAQYIDTVPMTADLVDEVTVIGNIGTDVVGRSKRDTDFTGINISVGVGGHVGVGDRGLPLGGTRKTVVVPGLPSNQNAANFKATAILEALLTENTNATLFVEADPTFVSYYNTIDLAIWDRNGYEVVNGRFVVNQVKYGLTPEDSLMRLEISKQAPYVPTFHASS